MVGLRLLFVALSLLVCLATTGPVAAQPVSATAFVVADVLNVRAGPGTHHAVVTTLDQGTKVAVVGHQNHWARITFAGEDGDEKSGWVHGRYLVGPGAPVDPAYPPCDGAMPQIIVTQTPVDLSCYGRDVGRLGLATCDLEIQVNVRTSCRSPYKTFVKVFCEAFFTTLQQNGSRGLKSGNGIGYIDLRGPVSQGAVIVTASVADISFENKTIEVTFDEAFCEGY